MPPKQMGSNRGRSTGVPSGKHTAKAMGHRKPKGAGGGGQVNNSYQKRNSSGQPLTRSNQHRGKGSK